MSYISDNFKNWTLNKEQYQNGRIAIKYTSNGEYGPEQECIATINLPDEQLAPDEVIIKTYSENEGLYEKMVAAGHISPSIRTVYSGFISAPVCRLLV